MDPVIPAKLPLSLNLEPFIPLIGAANRTLAGFNGILYGLPSPDVLLSPLTTQEAVLSSRIEGTQATFGEVLKFEAGEGQEIESRTFDIEEILNYRRALHHADQELLSRPFNLSLLRKLHEILLDSVRGQDKGRGHFRTVQNWIGAPGSPIERADFVPPKPEQLMEHLDNWEKYYHSDQPDMLIQLAIVHAQFEIIHPFLDGNGRLGRILIPLFLFEKKLLSRPVFYLSAYLEQHREEYIGRLRTLGWDTREWQPWIEFFLRAIASQAEANLDAARKMIELYERMKARISELTRSPYAVTLLDVLFKRPILSSSIPEIPNRQVTNAIFKKLIEARILEVLSEAKGRRAQVLMFPELLRLAEGR